MVAGTDGEARPFTSQSGRSLPLVRSMRETLQACAAMPCRSYMDVVRLSLP